MALHFYDFFSLSAAYFWGMTGAFGLMLHYPARGLQYSHSTEMLT